MWTSVGFDLDAVFSRARWHGKRRHNDNCNFGAMSLAFFHEWSQIFAAILFRAYPLNTAAGPFRRTKVSGANRNGDQLQLFYQALVPERGQHGQAAVPYDSETISLRCSSVQGAWRPIDVHSIRWTAVFPVLICCFAFETPLLCFQTLPQSILVPACHSRTHAPPFAFPSSRLGSRVRGTRVMWGMEGALWRGLSQLWSKWRWPATRRNFDAWVFQDSLSLFISRGSQLGCPPLSFVLASMLIVVLRSLV